MASFEFSPFGIDSIIVSFPCNNCGEAITSGNILIPLPDFSAENHQDSIVDDKDTVYCDCGEEYEIELQVGFNGGYGSINKLEEDVKIDVEEISDFAMEAQYDAILSNTQFYLTFQSEMQSLKRLNEHEIGDSSLETILKRQIYIGIIASLETYLSDAFINTVLKSKVFLKTFVKSFKAFASKSIPLNEVIEYYDTIEKRVKEAMLSVIYHNLPVVKGMYKDTLGVNLGDIGICFRAVQTRHDLVHRNGKTKDGIEVPITKEIIDDLIKEIENFVSKIDEQVEQANVIDLIDSLDI